MMKFSRAISRVKWLSGGFLTAQPFDPADSPRELHHTQSPGNYMLYSLVCLQSEMVGEGAYRCGWCGTPMSYQRSLKFIIMRAQRTVGLSAGFFGTLSMELFARVHTIPAFYNH
jgi:hypothetical protein